MARVSGTSEHPLTMAGDTPSKHQPFAWYTFKKQFILPHAPPKPCTKNQTTTPSELPKN